MSTGLSGAGDERPQARAAVDRSLRRWNLALPDDISIRASALLLSGLIALSVVARGTSARGVKSPWIFPDELIYSDVARSFAATAHFAIRGVNNSVYSVGYPFLLSAAFFHRDPLAAYAAAKWLNAILMSVAALPVFLLARRLLPNWLSLLAAGLALLIPAAAYSGVLMSENGFYPTFLFALLAIVRALERPTAARQAVALLAVGVGIMVRAQGLVLLPIYLVAIVALALSEADRGTGLYWASVLRSLRGFRATAVLLAAGAILDVAGQAVRGKPPASVLGAGARWLGGGYPLVKMPTWIAYHLVDLELYMGILPFVPATVAAAALLQRRGIGRSERAVAAVAAAAVVSLLVLVAAIAPVPESVPWRPYLAPAIHDRYTFYVVPLYLILFLYWLSHRGQLSNWMLVPLLAAGSLLPLILPYSKVHTNADFDALALLPWHNALIAERNVPVAMAITVCVVSLLLLIRRRSFVPLQVGLAATFLWTIGLAAQHNISAASLLVPSSHVQAPSWIDEAVPSGAQVAVLWKHEPRWSYGTTLLREGALWKAEFFNSSVKRFFYLGSDMYYSLPDASASTRNGKLVLPGPARYRYLLVASPIKVDGRIVGRDRKAHLILYRLREPI